MLIYDLRFRFLHMPWVIVPQPEIISPCSQPISLMIKPRAELRARCRANVQDLRAPFVVDIIPKQDIPIVAQRQERIRHMGHPHLLRHAAAMAYLVIDYPLFLAIKNYDRPICVHPN